MQSRAGRTALVAGAVVVAAAAFFALRSGGGEEASQSPAETSRAAPAGGGEGPSSGSPAEPPVTEIEVQGGAPQGGVTEIEVERGEKVEFVVRTDKADEVHVHGYDELVQVAPGEPARVELRADAEGIFEVELELSHVQIARLEVTP